MAHATTAAAALALFALAANLAGCGSGQVIQLPAQSAPQTGITTAEYRDAIASGEKTVAALTTSSPAVSAAVAVRGHVVWSAAFGFANLEARTLALPTSQFRIYSLSKVLTATAAMALAERGDLNLDVPIDRYVQGYPNPTGGVTTRLLLGHLAGIRHYRGSEALSTRVCLTPDDALEIFRNDPLEHEPGTEWVYSSWGYSLLSAVIAHAGKAPFDRVMTERVFKPVGLTSTEIEDPSHPPAKNVTPYEPDGTGVRIARVVDNRCKWGAGAYLSTAEDLARFAGALLDGKIVGPESVKQMLTPMTTSAGKSTGYGMGLGISADSSGRRRAVHSGSAIGGRSALVMLPDDGIVVVVLANVEGDRLTSSAIAIAMQFLRK